MAGEDLLCYLDGNVTLLSSLVQIQQVSSEARCRLQNSVWSGAERDNDAGREGEEGMGIYVCEEADEAIFKP